MEDLEVQPGVVIPGWEMWMTVSRSSGPGGQHANKTSTRVTIYWDIANTTALSEARREQLQRRLSNRNNSEGMLFIDADDTRSQHRNKEIARERLAEVIAEGLKVKKRRISTRPSQRARKRRLENKRQRGQLKESRQSPDPKDHS